MRRSATTSQYSRPARLFQSIYLHHQILHVFVHRFHGARFLSAAATSKSHVTFDFQEGLRSSDIRREFLLLRRRRRFALLVFFSSSSVIKGPVKGFQQLSSFSFARASSLPLKCLELLRPPRRGVVRTLRRSPPPPLPPPPPRRRPVRALSSSSSSSPRL